MTTVEQSEVLPRARVTGLVAIATGVASIVLLARHPEPTAKDFAGRLASEAASRGLDALVHGGFIIVLAVQLVCYAAFTKRIGRGRTAGLAAIVFFAMGVAFFSAALVLDGLAGPAVAARYISQPDKIEFARALYVLIGSLWGIALAGHSRVGSAVGVLLGVALVAAAAAMPVVANPLPLMGAIVGTVVWAVVAGIGMMRS